MPSGEQSLAVGRTGREGADTDRQKDRDRARDRQTERERESLAGGEVNG